MINWKAEESQILEAALLHGVDPFFIATIRRVENGGLGKEFGVLSVKAPTYPEQLRVCCATVRDEILHYTLHLYIKKYCGYGIRICYSSEFILYFKKQWAPTGVTNDPNNLNENWALNAIQIYEDICSAGTMSQGGKNES
jgi:hypothetical protein